MTATELRPATEAVGTAGTASAAGVAAAIDRRLDAARTGHWDGATVAAEAVELAGDLLRLARAVETRSGRRRAAKLARMMADPAGKAFTVALADQIFRPPTAARAAHQFRSLVDTLGVPRYLGPVERAALAVGARVAPRVPRPVMALVEATLRAQSSRVILPGDVARLRRHLQGRRDGGFRCNLNQLGEAILGDEEAERRLQANLDLLARPEVDYISVKISSISSQIQPLAFDETVAHVQHRLRRLYRSALAHPIRRPDGTSAPKFVNLDMEEYRDLHLTVAAFTGVLEEDEFAGLEAGIVLQAYLPDSLEVQRQLTRWAVARRAKGAAAIKLRIVKGANLAMERVEASLHGWEQAPYGTKVEVDANYKRMVRLGCGRANAEAVRLGVASHNLFDVAYALVARAGEGTEHLVEIEMLEGMADHQAAAVRAVSGGLLLYAPVVGRADFTSAIAYLVRRLDENTASENYLHDLFAMTVGSPAWDRQRRRFLEACAAADADSPSTTPNRSQDRSEEERSRRADTGDRFANEPDTDFTSAANRRWITHHLAARAHEVPPLLGLEIGGEPVETAATAAGHDPSRPGTVAYRYAVADAAQVDRALDVAVAARPAWEAAGAPARRAVLCEAGAVMARHRGQTIATMVADGAKAVPEADAEVSEAVDFAASYARAYDGVDLDGAEPAALGVVVVTPPWNFPYAIPAGGVLAALMAGNAVILKPAPQTVRTARALAEHLWAAGVGREVLQFVPCPDDDVGRALVTDPRTAAVVLTGAYETAQAFLGWRPDLRLFAETSGKNAMVITAAADPDQAVKDLVRSAFGHAGQKCSAASLAIVEAERYDDPTFRRQLRDAAASLPVGSAHVLSSVVTPLIGAPEGPLARALTTLEPGESWLLEPRRADPADPSLWHPGIRLGVRPGSWFHRTECFGPVLGVIRADHLDHAISIQNRSDFGLTGGIHTLDRREIDRWRDEVEVGNAYVNRGTTGAIVRRQPFGGWKRSAVGPGAKAGGPNYVLQFSTWRQAADPAHGAQPDPVTAAVVTRLADTIGDAAGRATVAAAAASQAAARATHFAVEHDPSKLHGESNAFRYRPVERMVARVVTGASAVDVAVVALAARTSGVELSVSASPAVGDTDVLAGMRALGRQVVTEDDDAFVARLTAPDPHRQDPGVIRHLGPVPDVVWTAAATHHLRVSGARPVASGRLELLAYHREQAVSESTHRYGNVVAGPEVTEG